LVSQSIQGTSHVKDHKVKTASLLCVAAAAAAFASPSDAIYKCTTAKGVVYQDRPCREGNETDVQIVIPTGEVAPRIAAAPVESGQANGARGDNVASASKPGRTSGDDAVSVAKPADRKTVDSGANAADNTRKRDARTSAESTVAPLTAEQAGKTEPSAKYYATDSFGPGGETPARMNCESPSGEKRVFYLSDGKLTSI
jgi:hypothetical protein